MRRLAAIDMYGTDGISRRRRFILAEFVVGLIGMPALGIWTLTYTSEPAGAVIGVWLIGAGLNYAPLATYAMRLSRRGALEAELTGVDTGRELRRYGLLQLWILVPLALVVMAIVESRAER